MAGKLTAEKMHCFELWVRQTHVISDSITMAAMTSVSKVLEVMTHKATRHCNLLLPIDMDYYFYQLAMLPSQSQPFFSFGTPRKE